MTEVFPRTQQQRLASLRMANEIRSARAELKRQLHARRVDVADLLADPQPFLATMKLVDLLRAVPAYGAARTKRVLRECRISEAKTVGGLSDRQRAELVKFFRGHAADVLENSRSAGLNPPQVKRPALQEVRA